MTIKNWIGCVMVVVPVVAAIVGMIAVLIHVQAWWALVAIGVVIWMFIGLELLLSGSGVRHGM